MTPFFFSVCLVDYLSLLPLFFPTWSSFLSRHCASSLLARHLLLILPPLSPLHVLAAACKRSGHLQSRHDGGIQAGSQVSQTHLRLNGHAHKDTGLCVEAGRSSAASGALGEKGGCLFQQVSDFGQRGSIQRHDICTSRQGLLGKDCARKRVRERERTKR